MHARKASHIMFNINLIYIFKCTYIKEEKKNFLRSLKLNGIA